VRFGLSVAVTRRKYPAQFSSQVRYVPHGVYPFAQLFTVPRVRDPSGENRVTMLACCDSGPDITISVLVVMRRL
jgi:hypothetical protein